MLSPDEGFSGLSDFFGFRSVGKILMTVNVIVGFTALFLMLGHVRWRDVVGGGEKPAPEG